jgi:BirA family biotin operon repressor/biotin-[acetyl-CoA-carboxylase] ligase
LSAEPWPAGVGRHVLDTVDSTNAEAARLAPGLAGPAWILAGYQTGGRGRRGRPWISPRGNFHATLMMRPEGPPALAALRSFAAALALSDALAALLGAGAALTLKWPNDVLLNGGKVAGILLESLGRGAGVEHLAIGIGVNLVAAPDPGAVEPGALRPVSVLAETGRRIAPEALLDALAPALARWDGRLSAEGFAPLREAWLARAAHLGRTVRARTGTAELAGVFAGIDAGGALLLDTAEGRRAVPAAEVFV